MIDYKKELNDLLQKIDSFTEYLNFVNGEERHLVISQLQDFLEDPQECLRNKVALRLEPYKNELNEKSLKLLTAIRFNFKLNNFRFNYLAPEEIQATLLKAEEYRDEIENVFSAAISACHPNSTESKRFFINTKLKYKNSLEKQVLLLKEIEALCKAEKHTKQIINKLIFYLKIGILLYPVIIVGAFVIFAIFFILSSIILCGLWMLLKIFNVFIYLIFLIFTLIMRLLLITLLFIVGTILLLAAFWCAKIVFLLLKQLLYNTQVFILTMLLTILFLHFLNLNYLTFLSDLSEIINNTQKWFIEAWNLDKSVDWWEFDLTGTLEKILELGKVLGNYIWQMKSIIIKISAFVISLFLLCLSFYKLKDIKIKDKILLNEEKLN